MVAQSRRPQGSQSLNGSQLLIQMPSTVMRSHSARLFLCPFGGVMTLPCDDVAVWFAGRDSIGD
ncbi:MAG: hypothetical protein CBB71_03880 [Rhodopirellula sp. TMED11]|nr:MAG: hypothetical protein CBB71_03880 [Rhodopirellula sp. TMED11]